MLLAYPMLHGTLDATLHVDEILYSRRDWWNLTMMILVFIAAATVGFATNVYKQSQIFPPPAFPEAGKNPSACPYTLDPRSFIKQNTIMLP